MTRDETKKVLAIIEIAYPNFYKSSDDATRRCAIDLWTDMFQDTPSGQVGMAVKALIATAKFPPTIAEVKEYIAKLTEPDEMSGAEAWRTVIKSLNGPDVHYKGLGWDYTDAFNNLPTDIRRVVGSPAQMRIWADTSERELENFVQRDFIRNYESVRQQQREYKKLPESVRRQSEQIKGVSINKLLEIAERKSKESISDLSESRRTNGTQQVE